MITKKNKAKTKLRLKKENNNNNNNNNNNIEITDKWYEHEPDNVMHNKDNNITITWDMPVNTDRTIIANRPYIIVKDSVNSTCKLIDMTVPSDKHRTEGTEKKASTKT